MRRAHTGCGMRNPWRWWLWAALILAQAVSWPVVVTTGSLWGVLGYIPWVITAGAGLWWEHRHRPRDMYVTWRP
jgi:hypothetical protein